MYRRNAALMLAAAVVAAVALSSQPVDATYTCDPFTAAYSTISYVPADDPCRTYTLYDVGAVCMPTWSQANEFCARKGMELAPWHEVASKGAISTLCTRRSFTCWASGPCDPGQCPLVDAQGYVHQQGCNQPVRFVCRTKGGNCNPNPNPNPIPTTTGNVMEMTDNGWSYRMYTTDATLRKTWSDADAYCKALQPGSWRLVPCTEANGFKAVKKMCSDNSFTCWFDGKENNQCPLISAAGDLLKQGCDQAVRFVCRKQL